MSPHNRCCHDTLDPPPALDRGGEGAAVHGGPRSDHRGVERHPVHQSG